MRAAYRARGTAKSLDVASEASRFGDVVEAARFDVRPHHDFAVLLPTERGAALIRGFMSTTVSFGNADSCEIARDGCTILAPKLADRAPVGNVAEALHAALAAPLDYPPLAAALAPGDRVAIALGKGVPHVAALVGAAIAELTSAGIEPADVTVLSAEPLDEQAALTAAWSGHGVRFEVHNPADEPSIAMVGMTAAHRPLRFNRTLAEADFVLPMALARPPKDSAAAKFGGLFPRFSDRDTAARFHAGNGSVEKRTAERLAESNEAGWLLGVGLTVWVVPGPGGAVAAIVAGEPGAAARQAAERFQAVWERPTPQRADLVIAAVTGASSEQTWDNLARAVAASKTVLSPEGAIAVCCEIEELPAGPLDKLRDAVDFAAVARKLQGASGADARAARILARALDRGPIYLLSRLPADVVESLGMTPIENDAELTRLAASRRHCVVIEEAQRVRPRLVDGTARS